MAPSPLTSPSLLLHCELQSPVIFPGPQTDPHPLPGASVTPLPMPTPACSFGLILGFASPKKPSCSPSRVGYFFVAPRDLVSVSLESCNPLFTSCRPMQGHKLLLSRWVVGGGHILAEGHKTYNLWEAPPPWAPRPFPPLRSAFSF